MDLSPGGRLRIVLPINHPEAGERQAVGYRIVYYDITGSPADGVRLKFASAQSTLGGKTTPEPTPPTLPFRLPRGPRHIRLVYLLRLSQSDHDMAILTAKHVDELDGFTRRLKNDPGACRPGGAVSCFWVPPGVAVRPEG